MAAAVKSMLSLVAPAALVLLLVMLAAQSEIAAAQNCSAGVGNLMQCAPFVLPGNNQGPPSQQCCNALAGVDHTCLCQTLDIISRLPTSCKLPQVTCNP